MGGDYFLNNFFIVMNIIDLVQSTSVGFLTYVTNKNLYNSYGNVVNFFFGVNTSEIANYINMFYMAVSPSESSLSNSIILDALQKVMDINKPRNNYFSIKNNSDIMCEIIFNKLNIKFNFTSPLPAEITNDIKYISTFLTAQFILFLILCFSILITCQIIVFYKNFTDIDEQNIDIIEGGLTQLVEVEKELTNLDDIFISITVFMVFIGWPFLVFTFSSLLSNYNLYGMYSFIPVILLIVLCIPLNILFDCGVAFVSFLRGSAASTIFSLEWMYDVLATGIMFVRLFVQHIRFVLMFFALFEIFEFVFGLQVYTNINFNLYSNVLNTEFTVANFISFLYFLLITLPILLINFLYQVGHFLFTVTTHFFAYFALIAWLYLYLYTNFLSEKLENLFGVNKI